MQDSRVLTPGRVRGKVSLGYAPPGAGDGHVMLEAGIRVGVVPRVELQAKLSDFGSQSAALKVAIRDRASPFRISLLTGVQRAEILLDMAGEAWAATRLVFGVNVTPVFGFRLSEAVELVVAPDLQGGFKRGYSNADDLPTDSVAPIVPGYTAAWLGVGARAGVALHVGAHVTFIPECSLLVVTAGPDVRPGEYNEFDDRTKPDNAFTAGDVRGQCGVAINMGSAYVDR
jgi:hypothetical protein